MTQMNIFSQPKTQDVKQQAEQTKQQQKVQIVPPKKVSYCPICTFPFQLCKYGKDAIQCAAFLFKIAPAKVNKYHPDFKSENIQNMKKSQEGKQQQQKQKPSKQSKDQKGKALKDKYIVIDVKNRGKKNFITTVSGLNNFAIDAKQLSKKCSKKFAVSCSALDLSSVQLQGDNFENMKQFLLAQYKQLKKKYIIDKQQFTQLQAQQKAKKKQARKLQQNAIKEQDEQEQPKQEKVQEVKDKNTIRMEMMKKLQEQEDDD